MAKSKKLTPLQKHRAETAAANEKGHPAVKKPPKPKSIPDDEAPRLVSGRGGGKSRVVKDASLVAETERRLADARAHAAKWDEDGRKVAEFAGGSVWDNLEGGLPSRRDR